jgi:putative phosphoribosyl transferase
MPFMDRIDAGKQLALALKDTITEGAIILALPRGGVPIGYEIAKALNIPLDVLIIRKLGTPGHEELAMGAVGPAGIVIRNEEIIQNLKIPQSAIEAILRKETDELNQRMRHFRTDRPFPELADKTVIIVDDGLATGATARAAIQAVQAMQANQLILAIPVCAMESSDQLSTMVNHLICLETPEEFTSVGYWYKDFRQTSDDEVIEILNQAWKCKQEG